MAEEKEAPKNNALAAAAARRAAKKQPESEISEDFEDGDVPLAGAEFSEDEKKAPPAEPQEDSVRTQRDGPAGIKAKLVAPVVVKATTNIIYDKQGNPRKFPDGEIMRYGAGEHVNVGFVSDKGVLFPNGYKYKGGHVQNGTVVLNHCPMCKNRQSIDEALSGTCANRECGYSAHEALEEYSLAKS